MLFYAQYPPSAGATNPSIGANGSTAPTSSTEVGGVGPDGNLHPLSTDNSGVLNVNISSEPGAPFHVIVDSSALPTGASTLAAQNTGNSSLSSIATAAAGLNLRTAGSLTPVAFDEVALTYVPTGNGAGQIATATYKLLGTQVKLLTLTYDSSNRVTDVVAT